jgi:hypothetical protein
MNSINDYDAGMERYRERIESVRSDPDERAAILEDLETPEGEAVARGTMRLPTCLHCGCITRRRVSYTQDGRDYGVCDKCFLDHPGKLDVTA